MWSFPITFAIWRSCVLSPPLSAVIESMERLEEEVRFARRMFADNNWPVIDVTRRSIEETAAAIIKLMGDHSARSKPSEKPI